MDHIVVQPKLTDEEADKLMGARLTPKSYDTLYRHSIRMSKPDGSLLAVYLREALPERESLAAYPVFRAMNTKPTNRGVATMGRRPSERVLLDGTVSKTHTIRPAELKAAGMGDAVSGVMGYMDRYPRMPFCRTTAFNMDNAELFMQALPFISEVDRLFAEHATDRYCAQQAVCAITNKDFIIPGTVFTTITVNRNFPTRVHKDVGDLKSGFGVMTVFRKGHYTGSHFVLPKYRVGFDMGNRDLLLADVHEWHGNTDLVGDRKKFERISCVFYYRERMVACGSAAEELVRAKQRQRTDKM